MGSRYQFTERKRRIIFNLTDGLCWYCGEPASTIDHMQPRSKQGTNKYGNLVPCCGKCNQKKQDYSYEEYRKRLTDTAMSRLKFANKTARLLFIENFLFYGESIGADPYEPARVALWKGFGDTECVIEIERNRHWQLRLYLWLRKQRFSKLLRGRYLRLRQRLSSTVESKTSVPSN